MKVHYLPKNSSRFPYFRQILVLVTVFLLGVIFFFFFEASIISVASSVWKVKSIVVTGENILPVLDRRTQDHNVLASILTYPPQTPYDIIIIDAGSNDFVALGNKVSMTEGPILGLVSEVFPRSAKVRLFTTSGEKTNAVLERNEIPVILEGVGGGNFRISLPRNIDVEKGDRILSRDLSSRLLAVVGDVSAKSTDSFKEIIAKSPANIFNLRFVFVTP